MLFCLLHQNQLFKAYNPTLVVVGKQFASLGVRLVCLGPCESNQLFRVLSPLPNGNTASASQGLLCEGFVILRTSE